MQIWLCRTQYDREVTYTLIPGGKCRVASREYASSTRGTARACATATRRCRSRRSSSSETRTRWAGACGSTRASQARRILVEPTRAQRVHVVLRHGARDAAAGATGASSARALIIQYSDNDFVENKLKPSSAACWTYCQNGSIRQSSETSPRDAVLPAQVCAQSTELRTGRALVRCRCRSPTVDQARYFLDVLLRHRASVEGRTVVVLEIERVQPERRAIHRRARALARRAAICGARAMDHGHRRCPMRSSGGTTTCWTAT